ncbi:hypothetical protein R1T40_10020 [Tritonibacter scottomollicae]|uniref:Uncharacterized protein n=1 Tax=Tritonibacter scottomollicae TaxID=483013 RepID=A0ABZ0HKP8_TRISK|nr:hypothetical protein R1T40_10020 [Tritonibacter scottomollicae]
MAATRFTKAEITRAVEAAKACDLVVSAVEIGPDGSIKIFCPVDEPEKKRNSQGPKQW